MTALLVKQDFEAEVSAWGITPEWKKKKNSNSVCCNPYEREGWEIPISRNLKQKSKQDL